jgi:hypothetical protein
VLLAFALVRRSRSFDLGAIFQRYSRTTARNVDNVRKKFGRQEN